MVCVDISYLHKGWGGGKQLLENINRAQFTFHAK